MGYNQSVIFLISIIITIVNFFSQDSLLGLMQNIALGFITIFIAVAIFLVDKDADNFELDRKVILDKVIGIKSFAIYFSLLFLPLFFWNISSIFFRFLFLIIYFYSVTKISQSLLRTYKWMNVFEPKGKDSKKDNFRMVLRLEYLKTVSDVDERFYEWNYIWGNSRVVTAQDNSQFFNIFAININSLLREKKYDQAARYLSNFSTVIEKLPLRDWLFYESILKNIFEWDKLSSSIVKEEDKSEQMGNSYYLKTTLESLIRDLTIPIGKNGTGYIYFETLKKHIEDNSKNTNYVEKTIEHISNTLFNLESDNLYSIFSGSFPEEWKVKIGTFKDNLVQKIFLYSYLNWTQRKIFDSNNQDKVDFDNNLETVSNELFPEVDPMTWALWISFVIGPFISNDTRVEDFLKRPLVFGHIGRVFTYTGDQKEGDQQFIKEMTSQRENTYQLLIKIFPGFFSSDNLKKYQAEAKSLKISKRSLKVVLISQINDILKLLPKQRGKKLKIIKN